MATAQSGNTVKIEYTGTLEDGTVFDSSDKQGKPLEFKLGTGKVIKGFDVAIVGMETGEEKEITLKPADAYGEPNPQLHKVVPKDKLPPGKDVKEGMVLGMQLPDGRQLPARVIKVGENDVTIDVNHPLAGKTLHFKLKLVDIVS